MEVQTRVVLLSLLTPLTWRRRPSEGKRLRVSGGGVGAGETSGLRYGERPRSRFYDGKGRKRPVSPSAAEGEAPGKQAG